MTAIVLAACDGLAGLALRNDAEEPLKIVWQRPGGQEYPVSPFPSNREAQAGSPIAPGRMAEAGSISGWPDTPPDIIVKAFSASGTLVYCRRFTPSEYRPMTIDHPLPLKPGDISCK
jgi:hypothetical protein